MKVKVFSADGSTELGIGDYVSDEPAIIFGREVKIPKIVMPNGKIVMGYECWWEPYEEAI